MGSQDLALGGDGTSNSCSPVCSVPRRERPPSSQPSQPVMWPGHAPYLSAPRSPRPKNQHSPQSGPTRPGLGGPLPEVTFLPLLPLLGFWFGFKFHRHFSVPLMLFFKGASFLKDLLHQALAIYLVFLGSVSTYRKKN